MTMDESLPWQKLRCIACIDYVKLEYPRRKRKLTGIQTTHLWHGNLLTIQNPNLRVFEALHRQLGGGKLVGVEISVDLFPKCVSEGEWQSFLERIFQCAARKFRPEDAAIKAYGMRAAWEPRWRSPKPFHKRAPSSEAELVYGHRDEGIQSKLYLKKFDENKKLPWFEHRVRLELALTGDQELAEFGLASSEDLINYPYRSKLSKHFRMVKNARVRAAKCIPAGKRASVVRRVELALKGAGAGKFAVNPTLPVKTTPLSRSQVERRSKEQIPWKDAVLLWDSEANSKIGESLRQLERRMSA